MENKSIIQRTLSEEDVKEMFGIKDSRTIKNLIKEGYLPPYIKHGKTCLFSMDEIYERLGIESDKKEKFITIRDVCEITGYCYRTIMDNIDKYPHYKIRVGHNVKYLFRKSELEATILNVQFNYPLYYHLNNQVIEQVGYLILLFDKDIKIPGSIVSLVKIVFIEKIFDMNAISQRMKMGKSYIKSLMNQLLKKYLLAVMAKAKERSMEREELEKEIKALEETIKLQNKTVSKPAYGLAKSIDDCGMSNRLKVFMVRHEYKTLGDVVRYINLEQGNLNAFLKYQGFGRTRNRELRDIMKRENLGEYIV